MLQQAKKKVTDKLVDNWYDVLFKSWSVWVNAFGVFVQGLEYAWPFFDGVFGLPQWAFALIGMAINMAAICARLITQRNLSNVRKQD